MGHECETASRHIDRSGDLDALGPGREDGTGAGVERVKDFLLITLADDDDERRGWMAIAPLSELFARRRVRYHRVDATLLDQSAHCCRVMGDAGNSIARLCAQQLLEPQPVRGIG